MLREVRDWLEELACRAGFDGLPAGGRRLAAYGAVLILSIGAWVWWGAQQPAPTGGQAALPAADAVARAEATRSTEPSMPATITVHVVGEVRHPGVYSLSQGARACDAVDAAGGLLGDADQEAVNLARVLTDGEQIDVPREGEVAQGTAAGGASGTASGTSGGGGPVDLNTATSAQLDTLPGVGPSTAAKIVADRSANGPFRTVEDLMRVPGIGPAKLEALRDLVTVR